MRRPIGAQIGITLTWFGAVLRLLEVIDFFGGVLFVLRNVRTFFPGFRLTASESSVRRSSSKGASFFLAQEP
ncbi:hypothetical protein BJV78DRAFT_1242265 [Lactifluus subvellereus]|nr:hypothetical protein BJV78DRAFT_1242265 [Lactifluus subvellereus]